MADVVEEALDIGIQNPVHLLRHDSPTTSAAAWHYLSGDAEASGSACGQRSSMNPVVEIRDSNLHPFFILAPCDSIHSRSRLFLQQIKAFQKQFLAHMMQQRCEP